MSKSSFYKMYCETIIESGKQKKRSVNFSPFSDNKLLKNLFKN